MARRIVESEGSYAIVDRCVGSTCPNWKATRAASSVAKFRIADPFPHVVVSDLVPPDAVGRGGAGVSRPVLGRLGRSGLGLPTRQVELSGHRRHAADHAGDHRGTFRAEGAARALSAITGIDALLPDPFLEGGGLHYTEPGGKLLPHTDFHDHPRLPLYRRVNALLYLNENWQPGDGGEVALFNLGSDDPVVIVPPAFGTCVLFATDHRSVHGVMPLAESGHHRKSIALYYYTVEPAEVFSGDRRTYWYDPEKPRVTGTTAKVRLSAMKAALGASKLLTRAAYRVDPQRPDLV